MNSEIALSGLLNIAVHGATDSADPPSTMNEPTKAILARQPIMNRQSECVGHELLFRNSNQGATSVISDGFACTNTVMQNLISEIGVDSVLGELDGFLNCNGEALASEFIDVLPARQMVLEILATVELTNELAQYCLALKDKGFRIALDDVKELSPEVFEFLPYVELVKIDWPCVETSQITAKLHATGKTVLAEKIETREDYLSVREIGWDLFQSFYFTRPQLVKDTSISVNAAA